MRHYLSTIDYGLWLSIIVLQLAACWTVVKKSFYGSWKAFSYYLFFVAAQSEILFGVSQLGSYKTYAFVYYAGGFTEAVLLTLVVLEVLVKVLDSFEALPGRTIAWFCAWLVVAVSLALVLSLSHLSRNYNVFINLPLTIQRTVFLVDAALLWVVLLQAKTLGVTWKSSVAEIAIGFVLFLTVQALSRFLVGIYDSPIFISMAGQAGQAAYLFALVGWIWTMFHRDPRPAPPSTETVTRMRAYASGPQVTKEKMLDFIGVKVRKVEEETNEA
ncbi:MAG TPA: hypothetical protein VKZ53_30200 [Candidatus Angelobacter sp.]|nr:hypothetical protein [Candidatus Angelobacter sp.]